MPRQLDTATLDAATRFYAHQMGENDRRNRSDTAWTHGPSRVAQDLFNAFYKDEHLHLVDAVRELLGSKAKAAFDELAKRSFTPREDSVFEALLAQHLAENLDGEHREGAIGKIEVGQRFIRNRPLAVARPSWLRLRKELIAEGLSPDLAGPRQTRTILAPEYWPIYAGEREERLAGSGIADPFPDDYRGQPVGADTTNIAADMAIAACDAMVDLLDEGSGAGLLRHYADSQPADPNEAVSTQTLLATNVLSDPAFGNAADDSPGGRATAGAIADDTAADATDTATWFRGFSSNDGATPLNARVDGNIGVASASMIVNTTAYVAGALIQVLGWTITATQGPTAT